jgi:hypothetical protein
MSAYARQGTLAPMAREPVREDTILELGDGSGSRPPSAMTVPPAYRPRKAVEVLELDMGDGVILYSHHSRLVHHLNPSAALLWRLCEGKATVKDLAVTIAKEYDLAPDVVLDEISGVIAEFDALNLVRDLDGGS